MGPLDFVLLVFFPGRFGVGPLDLFVLLFFFPGRFGVGPLDLFYFSFFLAVLEWAP